MKIKVLEQAVGNITTKYINTLDIDAEGPTSKRLTEFINEIRKHYQVDLSEVTKLLGMAGTKQDCRNLRRMMNFNYYVEWGDFQLLKVITENIKKEGK